MHATDVTESHVSKPFPGPGDKFGGNYILIGLISGIGTVDHRSYNGAGRGGALGGASYSCRGEKVQCSCSEQERTGGEKPSLTT